ncbi:MAG: transglutaminase-like cysteine peptidase [Sphingomicrobium sp.]
MLPLALFLMFQATPPLDAIGQTLDEMNAAGPEQPTDPTGLLVIPDNPAAPSFVVPPPPGPDVFGTRAAPGRITGAAGTAWLRVRDAGTDAPWLETLTKAVSTLQPLQQLSYVQASVNHRVAYRDDRDWWGREDYWATAFDTLRTGGGDCEDLAIVKYQALRRLGFPADSLYLSIGRDIARGDHALLLVRLDGRFLVLDDRNDRPTPAEDFRTFIPVLTFAANTEFVHGQAR